MAVKRSFRRAPSRGNFTPLMLLLYRIILIVLLLLALWRYRWAYVAFAVLGLVYFPLNVGFHLNPTACEGLPNFGLAVYSLQNRPHIVGFSFFFVLSYIQFRRSNARSRFAWAAVATVVMGLFVELAEGITGQGHCRMRDLVPDAAGALLGAVYVLLWNAARKRLSLRLAR